MLVDYFSHEICHVRHDLNDSIPPEIKFRGFIFYIMCSILHSIKFLLKNESFFWLLRTVIFLGICVYEMYQLMTFNAKHLIAIYRHTLIVNLIPFQ